MRWGDLSAAASPPPCICFAHVLGTARNERRERSQRGLYSVEDERWERELKKELQKKQVRPPSHALYFCPSPAPGPLPSLSCLPAA